MNILLKMNKFIAISSLTFAFLAQNFCMPPTNRSVSKEGAIEYFFVLISYNRNLDEPNNSFEEAKCIQDSGYIGIYPMNDIDYFKFETSDNNINLFIGDYGSFVGQYNLGFQIFDKSRILIYDISDPFYQSTNSNIVINKTLNQSECLIESCIPLTTYRQLELSTNIKQIYIKSYAFKEANYFEQSAIRIDSQSNRNIMPIDPRKLPRSSGSYTKDIYISNYSSGCNF